MLLHIAEKFLKVNYPRYVIMAFPAMRIFPVILAVIITAAFFWMRDLAKTSGAPPYGMAEEEVPKAEPFSWLSDWKRPDGPARVALQAGHWKAQEAPDELERLRTNTGSSGGGKSEWEVNLEISRLVSEILQKRGVTTEILPATVPPEYLADVFVAVHADGSTDISVSGFKIASPWRDWTGKAPDLADKIEAAYQLATGMKIDPNISRNMRGYYAFAFWRYNHAVHPMTTSVILETGFLTNAADRKTIVQNPQKSAQGLAEGILNYLEAQRLL
ncbi:MAG: Cell wall hydrolase/autolysin [Candidatus Amesbacteria bacterium GW2011_GWA1_47_16]|uniref:Cell wall hydrolase/autolysin n=3 Tax=Candidatus Amesiibacteriota TaxID=1752730 RepID=A0A0G1S4H6_9BACT|nr:MAG: Cell wall hydrolase/autolysin [Candidatus Amesbacteria bacterium GW2011_GWC1_47_15]KKU64518.1 MAG: Cell wall hydrolase/autolysin [Candidatus Amesbacteria bacterium GW2011_GWA1_47_16]KKU98062.1 MAG: Cell wall hydrolase/autolysin [Candidatus Amesbacteria bacterium GW2011_GWB1_48_13]